MVPESWSLTRAMDVHSHRCSTTSIASTMATVTGDSKQNKGMDHPESGRKSNSPPPPPPPPPPAIPSKFVPKKVLIKYEDDSPVDANDAELAGKRFAYDGENNLFSVGPLPQNKLEFTVVLADASSNRGVGNGSPL